MTTLILARELGEVVLKQRFLVKPSVSWSPSPGETQPQGLDHNDISEDIKDWSSCLNGQYMLFLVISLQVQVVRFMKLLCYLREGSPFLG